MTVYCAFTYALLDGFEDSRLLKLKLPFLPFFLALTYSLGVKGSINAGIVGSAPSFLLLKPEGDSEDLFYPLSLKGGVLNSRAG
jgi:hypothetical protein